MLCLSLAQQEGCRNRVDAVLMINIAINVDHPIMIAVKVPASGIRTVVVAWSIVPILLLLTSIALCARVVHGVLSRAAIFINGATAMRQREPSLTAINPIGDVTIKVY